MKINLVAIDGGEAKGAVSLPYRGYEISVSNVFMPGETRIFKKALNDDLSKLSFSNSAEGIRNAMFAIDQKLGPGGQVS